MSHVSRGRRLVLTGLVLALCLLLPACGNRKVTKANYDKIANGTDRRSNCNLTEK